jgi:hypothetical protein
MFFSVFSVFLLDQLENGEMSLEDKQGFEKQVQMRVLVFIIIISK